jgi:hypothetical protein
MKLRIAFVLFVACAMSMFAQEKPRVFVTDSQSWSMSGGGGGTRGGFGGGVSGGARPQTAEIIKTFGERCPNAMTNNIQAKADYIVVLDHEGGKGLLRKDNKVAVFERASGDSVMSKSTMSLGGSVQEACNAITKHWADNGDKIRAAAIQSEAPKTPAVTAAPEIAKSAAPKLAVASDPDGADIEVDGSFVGNTPSNVELAAGDHDVVIKKAGYKTWQRKLKLTGGEIKLKAELEKVPQ